jgi:hypothetical protein
VIEPRVALTSRTPDLFPQVRVPHPASHILGTILRRLRSEWQRKYHLVPYLAETFVKCERKPVICYRATNWLRVEQTTCRHSRHDRDHGACAR